MYTPYAVLSVFVYRKVHIFKNRMTIQKLCERENSFDFPSTHIFHKAERYRIVAETIGSSDMSESKMTIQMSPGIRNNYEIFFSGKMKITSNRSDFHHLIYESLYFAKYMMINPQNIHEQDENRILIINLCVGSICTCYVHGGEAENH